MTPAYLQLQVFGGNLDSRGGGSRGFSVGIAFITALASLHCGHVGIGADMMGDGSAQAGGSGGAPSAGSGGSPNTMVSGGADAGKSASGGGSADGSGGSGVGGGNADGSPTTASGGMPAITGQTPEPCLDYSVPERLTTLGVAGDKYGPSLTEDGLTLYFSALVGTSTGEVLYRATRPDLNAPFGPAERVPGLNGADSEGTPFINHDGSRLYYSIQQGTQLDSRDLYFAELAPGTTTFGTPTALSELNSESRDHLPWLSHDELVIYFDSGRGLTRSGIWTASRAAMDAPFGAPTEIGDLGALATTATSPRLSVDMLTLYFSAIDPREEVEDFWVATRASTESNFGNVMKLEGLSEAGAEDLDLFQSADAKEVYFSSDRQGNNEIWTAHSLCTAL